VKKLIGMDKKSSVTEVKKQMKKKGANAPLAMGKKKKKGK